MLQTPTVPDGAWEKIAADFIVKLPPSKEPLTGVTYDSIIVIVDLLTKYAHMIPYKEASNAEDIAYILFRAVFALHGTPKEIISDRDKLFTSKFWKSFAAQLGIKQKPSTAYHPQTDGLTERTNQTLEQYLRCYVNYKQNDWVTLLPMAQFAYNNHISALGVTPFYANYGRHPTIEEETSVTAPIAQRARIRIQDIQKLHEMMKEELKKCAEQSRKQANKKRIEGPTLKEGEMV